VRILKAGGFYFALVFSAGFVLGTIRTLWIVPRVGARTAELMEAPLMIVVSFLAARWVVKRLAVSSSAAPRLAVGGIGLAFMLMAELSLVLWLRGLTIGEYFATRDRVAGAVYYLALGLFALMPLMVSRGQKL
jgi:hypothetical protein